MLVAPVSLIVKSSCFSLKLFFIVSGTYSDLHSGVFMFHTRFTLLLAAVSTVISPLLAACFFYSLSLIFEYGAQLQQESDETL